MEEFYFGNKICLYVWLEYEGSCYYFSRDEFNWYKVIVSIVLCFFFNIIVSFVFINENFFCCIFLQMICVLMGGYMVVVNSVYENMYFWNFLLINDGKFVLKNWKKKFILV